MIRATGEQIPGIHLVHIKELKIYMPKEMHDQWAGTGMDWNTLSGIIAEEYKRQVLHEDSILPSDAAEILFPRVRNVTACFADGSGESDGPVAVVNHATRFDLERLAHMQRQLNL